MPRTRKRRGLPGRRLDRVHGRVNGARIEASAALAVATTPPRTAEPRTAPPRPPEGLPIRAAVAGPQFNHAQLYGPRDRAHKKVLCVIAAYADAGISDPAVREISHRCRLSAPDVLAIVRQLADQQWIAVEWAPAVQLRNRYALKQPPKEATQ